MAFKLLTNMEVFYDNFFNDKFTERTCVCSKIFYEKFCLLMWNTPLANVLLGSI